MAVRRKNPDLTTEQRAEVARFLLDRIHATGTYSQQEFVPAVRSRFGYAFIYTNENGTPAVDEGVYEIFRRLHGGRVHYDRSAFSWTIRYYGPGTDNALPAGREERRDWLMQERTRLELELRALGIRQRRTERSDDARRLEEQRRQVSAHLSHLVQEERERRWRPRRLEALREKRESEARLLARAEELVSEWKGDRAAIESAVTAASQMLAEIEQVPPPTPEGTLPMHTPLARARARLNRARDKLDRHDQWGKDLGAQLVKHRATVARLDEQIHSLKREIEEDPLE